ncbi:MAG: flagellar motor protein MotD [Gallionella sp.]|nr:flagellar motor protein MotD [Gallionella sp.]
MARRHKRIEHDNHDRWLISYADFVTLLFAFFVVMYSISSVNEGKYKVFSDSLSLAFSEHPKPSSDIRQLTPQEQRLRAVVDKRTAQLGEQQRKIQERMKAVADGLSDVMAPMVARGMVNITQSRRGVVLDISASALFGVGEATLQPESIAVMKQVAAILKVEDYAIEVEGHTDDTPIATTQFPSNWELSSARASSVVRMMIDNGVVAKRLTAVGLASNYPLAPNSTSEGRTKNRRVTITIVSPDVAARDMQATSGVEGE